MTDDERQPNTSTLAFAFATTSVQGFPGAAAGVSYPIALANKISGYDLRPGLADIEATINSRFSWYFGIDGITPAGQYDFVSVVLHELCHGLGFSGSGELNEARDKGTRREVPLIYDTFTELIDRDGTITAITNIAIDSVELKNALESNRLFCNGRKATAGFNGTKPQLYAPNPFKQG